MINNPDYKFYVLVGDKIESGWEYREDAREHLQDLRDPRAGKVYSKSFLKQRGIDPNNDASWLTGPASVMHAPPRRVSSRRQPSLPGFPDVPDPIEVRIPTMPWTQIGGDMSPGTYGGTIAEADGDHIELLKIQPVREYVGDREASDVGFPFWTREAWFDLSDLDPKNKDVQSALQYTGFTEGDQKFWFEEEATPEERAMVIAEALLDSGRGDEGPSGWSEDLPDHEVKWSSGETASLHEYLADEDDEFVRDVLLDALDVDYESYGPDENDPTNGLKVVSHGSSVEITEWTDIEDATGEEQPEGEKIVRRYVEIDLEELLDPNAKHRGTSSGDRGMTLKEFALLEDDARENALVNAALAYLGYWGGDEEFVDAIGD